MWFRCPDKGCSRCGPCGYLRCLFCGFAFSFATAKGVPREESTWQQICAYPMVKHAGGLGERWSHANDERFIAEVVAKCVGHRLEDLRRRAATGQGIGRSRGFGGHRGRGMYDIPAVSCKSESGSDRGPARATAAVPAVAPALAASVTWIAPPALPGGGSAPAQPTYPLFQAPQQAAQPVVQKVVATPRPDAKGRKWPADGFRRGPHRD